MSPREMYSLPTCTWLKVCPRLLCCLIPSDRILCFELVAKQNAQWILQYVKNATAETDVPSSISEFISQRRRWLNGTFFCQLFAIVHFKRFAYTNHSLMRSFGFMLQIFYSAVLLIFNWFAIANFYLSFFFLVKQTFDPPLAPTITGSLIFQALNFVYCTMVVAQFVAALGNRPQVSH